uniref:Ovule protein n=1 Tax=Romanomermis culicivorax TaxID=13658 RepID=A0A915L7T2_ROMCU
MDFFEEKGQLNGDSMIICEFWTQNLDIELLEYGHCKATSTYRLFWCFPHSHFLLERPHLRKKRWRIDEETRNEKNSKI